ncbi:MAG: tetratricopeptide repeat protein, partial [Planctomycetota bacterium]
LGRLLAKAGRLDESIHSLSKTVSLAPNNQDARLTLADTYQSAGKPKQAAEQLAALSEKDPDNADYIVRWGNLVLDDKSIKKEQRQTQAFEIWTRLSMRKPDDPVTLSQVADLMRRIDRVDEAIRLYRQAIALRPEAAQYREYLGEYLHRLDRKPEALEVWTAIAEGDRKNRDSLIRLAEVLNTFKYSDKSLAAFEQAMSLDPTFNQRLRFASLLAGSDRFDDSLAQLDAAQTAAESPEEREQVLRARIGVYTGSGKLTERIEALERSLAETTKPTADDYRRLAMMLDAAAETPRAIEAITESQRLAPDNTVGLSVMAELLRKNAQFADAIQVYRKLSNLETRFRSNYLKRIAGLQMRMGQPDAALETARELIANNPGSPDAHRHFADLCFEAQRDDEGIAALRYALRIAPRDSDSRNALARVLADRFRTDEAIELYWQSLEAVDDIGDQRTVIAWLAPLYDRKGDLERLVNRVKQRGQERSDTRSALLLIAEAYRQVDDLGSARQTLEPLLAENPRDAELLTQVGELAEKAGDYELAFQYQQQLVALADTPEHRRRELMLMVDAGLIEQAEATVKRAQQMSDPTTMVALIDRMITRRENETAIDLCRVVLEKQPQLWEVKLRLAGLLFQEDQPNECQALVNEFRSIELPFAQAPESKPKKKQSTVTTTRVAANPMPQTRTFYTRVGYDLARHLALGRYSRYGYSSSSQSNPWNVSYFGQAKFAAFF